MVKRREVVKFLQDNGFVGDKGKRHEHFVKDDKFTQVPRHREISEEMFEKIKKQAGLKLSGDTLSEQDL